MHLLFTGHDPRSLFSQVDKAFDNGLSDLRGPARNLQMKRNIEGKMVLTDVSQVSRHRSWLRRGRFGVVQAAWRPRKVFRVGAKKWAANLDNQLRVATLSGGLKHFREDKRPCWQHWAQWPHISFGLDLGSDGLCAVQGLLRKFLINGTMYPDFSHLYHRAQIGAFQDAQIYRLWLLLMVSWNLVHGKDLDDSRYQQLQTAMKKHFTDSDHNSSVLFNQYLPGIAAELEAEGFTWTSRAKMPEEVWSALKDKQPLKGTGTRMNLCRFQGVIQA